MTYSDGFDDEEKSKSPSEKTWVDYEAERMKKVILEKTKEFPNYEHEGIDDDDSLLNEDDDAFNYDESTVDDLKERVYKKVFNTKYQYDAETERQSMSELDKNSFSELFKQNKFKEVFQKASFTVQVGKNRDATLEPFFKLVTEASLKRIFKANRMIDFVSELNKFLDNRLFNEHERKAFLNGEAQLCLLYSLNAKNFECAEKINKYRNNKGIKQSLNYIGNKVAEEEFETIHKLFELSDSITSGNSVILRLFYNKGCRDFENIKTFIDRYHLDINGLGTIPNASNQWTFAQAVVMTEGTKANTFFDKFIKEFGNKIDFDIQFHATYNNKKLNYFECLIETNLPLTNKLDRFASILENCNLSEKHIGFISQYLLNVQNGIATKHYDHSVFKTLFSHDKFNSNLYDREAFLNKLMQLDVTVQFNKERLDSHSTVNPTSVILDTFLNYAKPALPMEQHPFITWVKLQNDNYSRDTFNSLMIFYKDELQNIDLGNITVNPTLVKALKEYGIDCPEKAGFFSFWKKKPKEKAPVAIKQIPTAVQEVPKPTLVSKEAFNTILFEQVKDEQVKKYIDSIILNSEQFDVLFNGKSILENEHYMANLLPKFLNRTVENYLHFSTIEEEEAKNNVLTQLKIINKKTFEVLNYALEHEKDQIVTNNAVHHKILKNY